MKFITKRIYWIVALLLLVTGLGVLNYKYQVVAFNLCFGSSADSDRFDKLTTGLKVLTWNIHCSNGTDAERQRTIAELILKEDADFVQLNEFNQDSCVVIDSLLKTRYPYAEEYQSHQVCGDIYYSKRPMSNSGHVWIPINGKAIQTLKATIAVGRDSVQIFGVHMASNSGDGSAIVDGLDSLKLVDSYYQRYKLAQEHRNFQAHWTKVNVLESKHHVIVMGDMNDFNCSAPLDTLTSCGLKDAWWEGGTGYGCTFHAGWMRLRIDHVLYGNLGLKDKSLKLKDKSLKLKEVSLELTGVKVISTDLSDHNPIVAEFKLKR